VSRDDSHHHQQRLRLAQLAARLMVEHGIHDHALAKRKAARQLGIAATGNLPGNDEIDAARKDYLALFEPEAQALNVDALRQQAVEVMTILARFQPLLIGDLALGTASRHTDIELEVYSDSSKEFEQFLLNRDIAFKAEERRSGSFFILFAEPANVVVRILPGQTMQSAPRTTDDPRRRLTADQLRLILATDMANLAGDRNRPDQGIISTGPTIELETR